MQASDKPPVFGMVLMGGPLAGARIHHTRLANELSSRGYDVHVWWVADRTTRPRLRREIREHWLFGTGRYSPEVPVEWLLELNDCFTRAVSRMVSESLRVRLFERSPFLLNSFMKGLLRRICLGAHTDVRLATRFAGELEAAGVSHVMPMLSFLSPWIMAARSRMKNPPGFLVTFQGYEVCANYARDYNCESRLYDRLREAVEQSDWPALTLSRANLVRVARDIRLPESSIRVIPPGIPEPDRINRESAFSILKKEFPDLVPQVPIVSYFGRLDSEKGVDLLLYAASLLRERGLEIQLMVCGPILHGDSYARACRQIAENMRLPITWGGYVSDRTRSALFAASRVVVCPAIHHEPFGMVPVEAMSYGTPVIVSDSGGIVEAVTNGKHTGALLFRTWDSGDLARRLERLLTNTELWRKLANDGPLVAAAYSIPNMTDLVLDHVGIPANRESERDERTA